MKSIGFGYPGGPDRAANLENPVTTYSGGWKMKMQLCAAQLMDADVLMLDEPTGHLDVDNIKWLEDCPRILPRVHHLHLPLLSVPRQDVHPHHRFPGQEAEDLQGGKGSGPHPVCGKVPREEGLLRAHQ